MYTNEKLAPHVKEIKQALGNTLTEATIEQELQKYLDLRVPLEEAKRGIVTKYGGEPQQIADSGAKKLENVTASDRFLELVVKIVSVNPRTITVKGEERVIHYGLMADETMTRPFTSWEDFKLVKGEVYEIIGAYTKTWRGDPEIQLGSRTRVRKLEDEELEVSLSRTEEGTPYKLSEVTGGIYNVIVVGKILELEEREVTARGEQKTLYSGTIADETAKVGYTAWADFGLKEGDILRIANAYVKEWRGIPQVTFDNRATVTKLDPSDPAAAAIAGVSTSEPYFYTIEELDELSGAVDAAVEGVVLEVRDGSGLIYRCPMCKRKLREGECMTHGPQDGQPDLRIKAVLDDGTGALSLIANRELTEAVLGTTLDAVLAKARASGDDPSVAQLEDLLLARPYIGRGNVTKDDYGLMMIAKALEEVEIDIEARAQALADELEGWS